MKKGVWNRAFKAQTDAVSKTAFVADAAPSFFLPVRLGAAELAQALREDAPEDALSPFKEALGRLGEAKPAFDAVMRGLGAAT